MAFVDAFAAAARNSVQPVEDLAAVAQARATTNAAGEFTARVSPGRYFVFVSPSPGDPIHLPGGSLSRESRSFSSGATDVDITVSETPTEGAVYVGSSACLFCHTDYETAKETLHFLGFRGLTAAGPQLSSLQDLTRFPDANGGLTYYPDGNANDNTGSNSDGFGYRIPTSNGYTILLGLDGTGYFQAIEGDGGLVSEKLYIPFTYGGEGRFKQRYITRLDVNGSYTAAATLGSYHVLPGQFSETTGMPERGNEVTEPLWVPYHPERWAPPQVDGGRASLFPSVTQSFDNQCAGCHFTGMSLSRTVTGLFQADAADDPGGPIDFDGDGSLDEMNVGCERCHGPGSQHVLAVGDGPIVNPKYLSPGRANMVCGQCHTRGNGNGTLDGEGLGGYASRNDPDSGQIEFVQAGVSPAEFFGKSHGTGILPSFGTQGGFFNPIDTTTSSASWKDASGGFGSVFDHSKSHRQQYLDHARALHLQNPYHMLACADCHDSHGRELPAQVRARADNNVLCLDCHAGHGDFAGVSDDMVALLAADGPQDSEIAKALDVHVSQRVFDVVGVAMSLGASAYDNPEGGDALGRCITCHMPKTAKSASWIEDDEGFVIEGDISSHGFDIILPETGQRMSEAGTDPVPNSCVPCHRGIARGAWPDYRHAK